MANEPHPGCLEPDHSKAVNVTVGGTSVFGFKGRKPTLTDLHRKVWAFDDTTVGGALFKSEVEMKWIVDVESTSDGRLGVRVCIDEAAAKWLPSLPGRVSGAPVP